MSSSILPSNHLQGHWEVVEEGAASAGRTADRSQWRIARDVLVDKTPDEARQRAKDVLERNWYQHQLPNRSAGLLVSSKIDPEMPVVYGDRVRLLEVLQNLIDNAVKFMGDQPRAPHRNQR